ncbi:hypothetical protein BH10PSE7_BH10PSE7_05150 [soil metagenome]
MTDLPRKRITRHSPSIGPERIDPRTRNQVVPGQTDEPSQAANTSEKPLRRRVHGERQLRTREAEAAPRSSPGELQRRIDNPAGYVLAVRLANEPWAGAEAEILGAARKMADAFGGAVILQCFRAEASIASAGRSGADRLLAITAGVTMPDQQARAILSAVAQFEPRHILFCDAPLDGDAARRVAVALGDRPAVAVQKIDGDTLTCRGNGGRSDFTRAVPRVILLAPGTGDPVEGGPIHEARAVSGETFAAVADPRIRDLGPEPISVMDVPLDEADFIVSAGEGVSDWPQFFAMAESLSGVVGGSRQVCDAGLLPRNRQVGASGTLVSAKCYLAFGISGAPQHLQGVQHCKYVVAVNTDLHAAMVKRAELAIIADAQQVMPELAKLARAKHHAR